MSQVAGERKSAEPLFTSLYAPVREELDEVETLLHQELRSNDPFVSDLVHYSFSIGGKRLRPALLLLAAKATGETAAAHVTLSAVVEMIHTATLIHDDVLDEATLRRHADTVNIRWNNESSVLLGDFLFTHAFYLAGTLENTYACQTIGRATNIVCEGELRQISNCGNLNLSEAEYLEIIEAKTAELCACCCQLGAYYAGADREVVNRLRQFGRDLGISFQIADDLLDMLGDETTTGKSLGTDLSKQKSTLPLIHALHEASPQERSELVAMLTRSGQDRPVSLRPWLDRFGAVQYTQAKAAAYAAQARSRLADLPWSPARAVLERLAEFVVDRNR